MATEFQNDFDFIEGVEAVFDFFGEGPISSFGGCFEAFSKLFGGAKAEGAVFHGLVGSVQMIWSKTWVPSVKVAATHL